MIPKDAYLLICLDEKSEIPKIIYPKKTKIKHFGDPESENDYFFDYLDVQEYIKQQKLFSEFCKIVVCKNVDILTFKIHSAYEQKEERLERKIFFT